MSNRFSVMEGLEINPESSTFAGIGAYFVQGEKDVNGLDTEDESDTIVGGKFLAGFAYDITDALFIGIEGKYIFTEQANLGVDEFNLHGYTATGVFWYKVLSTGLSCKQS